MAPPPPPHQTDEHGQDASASMEDDMHAPLWTLMLESGGTPDVANNDEDESCNTNPQVDRTSGPTYFKSGAHFFSNFVTQCYSPDEKSRCHKS